ncbi:hypothetical protein EMCRGX_G021701 [Ephydatia muelleri]
MKSAHRRILPRRQCLHSLHSLSSLGACRSGDLLQNHRTSEYLHQLPQGGAGSANSEEWGSWKALEQELMKRKQEADEAESSEAKKRGCSYKKATQISHTARLEHEQEAFGYREERVTFLEGSAKVVAIAIASNFAVLLIKAFAYYLTGSASILSEAMHSLVVALNQSLVAIGTATSKISLWIALKQVHTNADEYGMSIKDYVLCCGDTSAVAVLLEEGAAITGIFVATISVMLSYLTLNPIYDAVGSIAIGGLLGAVSFFLITRSSSALIGRYVLASFNAVAPPTAHAGPSLRKD